MTTTELDRSVAELMSETGKAHHQAFLATAGDDPEWPIWYADYLHKPLGRMLDTPFTRSQLIYCLMDAEFEREVSAPDTDWATYYAGQFVERYAPTETPAKDKLALYYMPTCPFCKYVLAAITRHGIDVELRDIADEKHREDLIAARSRATVPVLRITPPDGNERWMPESSDIVRYLKENYQDR